MIFTAINPTRLSDKLYFIRGDSLGLKKKNERHKGHGRDRFT